MRQRLNLLDQKFGRLTVIKEMPRIGNMPYWLCKCECGKEKAIPTANLKSGNTRSCGCLQVELSKLRATTHGGKGTSEYSSWRTMRRRCYDVNHKDYPNYGARGIIVCERWKNSFSNFLADMGKKSDPTLTLDRKESNGNYELANCRWADSFIQANNTRRNVYVSYNEERLTITQWMRRFNIHRDYFYKKRVNHNMTNEQILNELFSKK